MRYVFGGSIGKGYLYACVIRQPILYCEEGTMPEKKESKEASRKEDDLKQAPPKRSATPTFTHEERADYWREQDPKYTS